MFCLRFIIPCDRDSKDTDGLASVCSDVATGPGASVEMAQYSWSVCAELSDVCSQRSSVRCPWKTTLGHSPCQGRHSNNSAA